MGQKPVDRYNQIPAQELSLNHVPATQKTRNQLPKHFNWCKTDEKQKSLCVASWNQHIPEYCGACWAHGTLSMIQDRIKIGKGGKGQDVMLARQALLNCAHFQGFGDGCDGGEPIDVFRYMHQEGLPDESCIPYSATDHSKFDSNATSCPAEAYCLNCMPDKKDANKSNCWPVKTPVKYGLKSFGKIEGCGEEAMMSEIFARGPITCSTASPDAFIYDYRGGVYAGPNDTDIDHDVEIVGWGEETHGEDEQKRKEEKRRYWIVRNSWGTFWGELGYYRVERGTNMLRMEECDCWYAIPDFEMEKYVLDGDFGGSMYGLVPNQNRDVPRTQKKIITR
eukprot:TRINITY_DN14525_c0_g1_i2.p2 TRINITY_DN14525_c0_g1~~TRINITY_DN14525_c0_g1_i2.p2  ORF type:complete len:336 (+),score=69.21 TRINITY_DN14525_c0_g1_i2:52-1059(+)